MEIILKSHSETSLAKIIALAKKLNVTIEETIKFPDDNIDKEELKKRILNFKFTEPSSFGDPVEWQNKMREDNELPFSK